MLPVMEGSFISLSELENEAPFGVLGYDRATFCSASELWVSSSPTLAEADRPSPKGKGREVDRKQLQES